MKENEHMNHTMNKVLAVQRAAALLHHIGPELNVMLKDTSLAPGGNTIGQLTRDALNRILAVMDTWVTTLIFDPLADLPPTPVPPKEVVMLRDYNGIICTAKANCREVKAVGDFHIYADKSFIVLFLPNEFSIRYCLFFNRISEWLEIERHGR